jgi:hypothetical protein
MVTISSIPYLVPAYLHTVELYNETNAIKKTLPSMSNQLIECGDDKFMRKWY